jgi:hypothetical protein
MEVWKPIETAPKDGRQIRVKRDDSQETVVWSHPLSDWAVGHHPQIEGCTSLDEVDLQSNIQELVFGWGRAKKQICFCLYP